MANTKHTPGTWRFIKQSESNGFENEAFLGDIITDKWSIAGIWRDVKEAEANAQLLAAAPELLEALQSCLHILLVADMKTSDTDTPYTKAKAAIAKATGKEVSDESK